MRFHPLPPGLGQFHPIALISTWFGSGRIAFASGTWGSLAALPFAVAISWWLGQWALVPASLAAFALGVWASGHFSRRMGVQDPSAIVIDEVAGQWLTLAFVPLDPVLVLVGFLLFRIADIIKPFPANWADSRLHGGLGVMLDDMIAGLYAGIVLWGVHRWIW